MATLATVNVVQCAEANIESIHSFTDDEEGSKEAADLFKACVIENGDHVTEEEMTDYLEEGYFEQGDYQVFLTRAS